MPSDQIEILITLFTAVAEIPPQYDCPFIVFQQQNGEYALSHPGLAGDYVPNWLSIRRLLKNGVLTQLVDQEAFELSEEGYERAESAYSKINNEGSLPNNEVNASNGSLLQDNPSEINWKNEHQLKAFVAYSHQDKKWLDEFRRHSAILQRSGVLNFWYDGEIRAGEEWDRSIKDRLNTADVFFPLVSSDFLASDYSWSVELQTALSRHSQGSTLVIPIIVRACDWKQSPLGDIQALPYEGKPVSGWATTDETWVDVIQGVRQSLHDFRSRREQSASTSDSTSGDEIDDEEGNNYEEWGALEIQARLEEIVENIQIEMDTSSVSVTSLGEVLNQISVDVESSDISAKAKNRQIIMLSQRFRTFSAELISSAAMIESNFLEFDRILKLLVNAIDFSEAEERKSALMTAQAAEEFVLQIRAFCDQVDGARRAFHEIPNVSRALSSAGRDLDYALLEFSNSARKGSEAGQQLAQDIEAKSRSFNED